MALDHLSILFCWFGELRKWWIGIVGGAFVRCCHRSNSVIDGAGECAVHAHELCLSVSCEVTNHSQAL